LYYLSIERKDEVQQNVLRAIVVLMMMSMLTACSSAATATPTEESLPTALPIPELPYHPLDTRSNIPEIDVIIGAVAGGDPQELRNLFEYTTIACMTVNALGGPPPCREGEAEGTPVEVLPSLGPEGSFLRKDEAERFPGLDVMGLYAVYRVPDSAFTDPNYPAGDYAIAYVSDDDKPAIVLQVRNGKIVRIDYVFGYPAFNEIVPDGVTDFVLEPVAK
jgi:major membrane immunogen (membrane-anchored lipoprotein)